MRPVLLAAFAFAVATPSLAADPEHPLVIELFQSQGCSSCPPANASLIEFAKRPDVLALNFAIDYWDRLGWKDTFATPAYTERQYGYARSLGDDVYTPEIVVNGRASGVGSTLAEMEATARRADRGAGGPSIRQAANAISVGAGPAPNKGAEVWLVDYDPKVAVVAVARGENAGRTLAHGQVVHGLTRLGAWTGAEARFDLPASRGYARAVIVQEKGLGPVLAAARI